MNLTFKEFLVEISKFKEWELRQELRHEDEMNRYQAMQRRVADREAREERRRYPGHKRRQYLNVPYAEKEEAKRQGARWDPEKKKWYIEVFANQKWAPAGYEHWWQ